MLRNTKFLSRGALLVACAVLCACLPLPINAASNTLRLTNVEVEENSDALVINNTDFSDNTISGDINLKQLNDTITLSLTLENDSDIAYTISGVSDNLTENYLSAEYDYSEEEIAPGETTTIKVILTYINKKDGVKGFRIDGYSIAISLLSENGESQVIINPKTGDGILSTLVLVIITSVLSIIILIIIKNKRIKVLIAAFALSSAIMLPATISAKDADVVEVKFDSITLGIKTISSISKMQEMTSSVCEESETNEKNTLTDTREGGINRYAVGKAADGECWMIQNLRLGSSVAIGGSIVVDKVSNESGEISGTFELSGKTAESAGFRSTDNNGFGNINDNPQFTCKDGYDCYYNWTAVTAGTGLSSFSAGDASDSICPKGWALPSKDQFEALLEAYPTNDDRLAADLTNSNESIPGFTLSGEYFYDGLGVFGNNGEYWARTAFVSENGLGLYVTPSYSRVDGTGRVNGRTVRCIAQ